MPAAQRKESKNTWRFEPDKTMSEQEKHQVRIAFSLAQLDSQPDSLLSFRQLRGFFQTKLEASCSHSGACKQL